MRDKLIEVPLTCEEPYLELLLKVETRVGPAPERETLIHRVLLDSGVDTTDTVDITKVFFRSEHLYENLLRHVQAHVDAENTEEGGWLTH